MNISITEGERRVLIKHIREEIRKAVTGGIITVGRLSNLYSLEDKLKQR